MLLLPLGNLPFELLLVSKSIHKEVSQMLYSKNKIILRGHSGADLAPLLSLALSDLAWMGSLLVRLNCWPCPFGHEGFRNTPDGPYSRNCRCRICHTPQHQSDPEFSLTTGGGRDSIRQLEALCSRLSAGIIPGQLDFTFICDCRDAKAGEQVSCS